MPESAPLRVLVACSLPWFNAAAAHALAAARGLAARGHHVAFLGKPGSPVVERARAAGLTVHADHDLTATRPDRLLSGVRWVRRILTRERWEVIDAHRSEDHLLCVLAGRVPVVRTRNDIRAPRRHPLNRVLYDRGTAAHVACADFMPARFYRPLGIPSERVTVVRPWIDADDFAAEVPDRGTARRELGLAPETPVIGLIGRFQTVKGHWVLLEAFARLQAPAHLLLSGYAVDYDGDDLRIRARELGVADRVTVAPVLPDVRLGLGAIDVLAVPSLGSEAVSRIALEAQAAAVPVVASNVNGLPEAVGDPERLVPPGDPEALAAVLDRMLADAAWRERAARWGAARVRRRFREDRGLERLEACLAAVVGRG